MIQKRSRDWDRHSAESRSRFLRGAQSAIAIMGFALALIGMVRPAQAQYFGEFSGSPNIEGFTVAGKAAIAAKPNLIEIDVEVSASSELTADAIVKYRDARRRLHEAFSALKLADITVEERGLQVDQKGQQQSPYFGWGGQQNTRNKTEVQLTRKLVVKASNLRKMDEEAVMQLVGKLLDVAQDAGAKVGPQNNNSYYYWRYDMMNQQGLVRFVLDDFDKLQEEAYDKAFADARSRAERLARLSHVALGPIVAAREIAVPGDRANYSPYYNNYNSSSDDEMPRKRLETSKYQDIPVKVELMVRFTIQSKPDAKGKTGEKP